MSKTKLTVTAANTRAPNLATSNLVEQLDQLSVKCAEWESGAYKTASEGLYALLADCLNVYNEKFLNADDRVKIALRKELIERLSAAGIRVVKSTMTLHLLVRYTFKSDRRRAHVYGYVLRAAVDKGLSGENLPAYIRAAGGIEEIRRQQVISEETLNRRKEVNAAMSVVLEEIEHNTVAPLGVIAVPSGEDLKDFCVVLGKPKGDGTIALVSVLADVSEAMVNQFKQKLAKVRASQAALQAQVAKEAGSMQPPADEAQVAEDEEVLAA